jgi:hypothetical protein
MSGIGFGFTGKANTFPEKYATFIYINVIIISAINERNRKAIRFKRMAFKYK